MDFVKTLIQSSSMALEIAGIVAIGLGAIISTVNYFSGYARKDPSAELFSSYRRHLSRAILLGLEFLVAADIIRTVAIEPTFSSVGILASIVLIRTFLSFTLEVEISGKWPWSHGNSR